MFTIQKSPWAVGVGAVGLRCESTPCGVGAVRISAVGELDVATAPQLEGAVHDALASAKLVVLDLRDVTFIDVAGVHTIAGATLRASLDDRRVVIAFAPPHVAAVFALTGTADIVTLLDLEIGASA